MESQDNSFNIFELRRKIYKRLKNINKYMQELRISAKLEERLSFLHDKKEKKEEKNSK